MRILRPAGFTGILCALALIPQTASACRCSGIHGKNYWDGARLKAEGAAAIFEGTPERIETQWSVLIAKRGELITAEDQNIAGSRGPRILVNFRVRRAYKGDVGLEVQINTGVTTMDCSGARFSPGLNYLVYAYSHNHGELWTFFCSPGGQIDSGGHDTELRFLRNERPTASDLASPGRLPIAAESAGSAADERRRRYVAATGNFCGIVTREGVTDPASGVVLFLSAQGYSPYDYTATPLRPDGSFCSDRLGPGKYFLHYSGSSRGHLTSSVFYPGVSQRERATAVEVIAGKTQSGIIFHVPEQKTYSVHGVISTNDKSALGTGTVSIQLISLDGSPSGTWDYQQVHFDSPFPLSNVKYFHFDDVLPGRYVVYPSVMGQGWFTRKVEVNVTNSLNAVFLELTHKK